MLSKWNMSRHPDKKRIYFQTFVRSFPDHRALQIKFMRSSTKVLVRACPDHRAFTRPKNTSCGAVLFLEDEGGRGFLKINYFHRVNLLLKLNQFSLKNFGVVCLEKTSKNRNLRFIQIKCLTNRCLYRTKGLSMLNQIQYGVFLM